MRIRSRGRAAILIVAPLLLAALLPVPPAGAQEVQKRAQNCLDVLQGVLDLPEHGISTALLADAQGVAVIPDVVKVAFVIGGRYGKGMVLVREEDGSWSPPVFIQLMGGSVGWQIGAQSTDVVLVFKTRRSVEGLLNGKFTLGADAAVAAGPVGRQAEASTDAQLKAEIYSYARSRGAFAGISLEGSALQVDQDADAAFYGEEGISPERIAAGDVPREPTVATRIVQLLTTHAPPP